MKVNTIAKAVTAALAAGYVVFDAASEVRSDGGTVVTVAEWVRVAVSALVAGLAVYAVPNDNRPKAS